MEEKKENQNSSSKKSAKRAILTIAGLVMLIAGVVYLGYYFYGQYTANIEDEKYTEASTASQSQSQEQYAENPIDFDEWQKKNDEIYAWIKVDGTEVDYPIVQSGTDDDFYLRHSAADKSWVASGAIFTQSHNTKTFNDSVTVIYGHNGYSESMFTSLHKFEKKDFFDEHPYFYIYMPQRKLTYQVVSAFKYDDRHIMNSFDFQDSNVLADFQEMIQDPSSSLKNVREDLDTEINSESKLVVLSTCITGQKSSRYLVCGVLVNDEKTN